MILLNNWKQKAKKLPEYIVKHEFQLGIIRNKNNNTNKISTVQNVCSTKGHKTVTSKAKETETVRKRLMCFARLNQILYLSVL